MPPFFNRLQGLLPQQQYPYPTPTFPYQGINNSFGDTGYVGQDIGGINNRLSQLAGNQQSQSPLMDQYLQYLQQYPKPADYKPGKLDRLSAALSGVAAGWRDPAAGVGIARNILEHPYQQALELYQLRGKGLEQGAQLEERGQIAAETARVREEAIQRQREADRAREAIQTEQNKIRQERADVYKKLGEDRNNKMFVQPGGTVHIIKPDGTSEDTGIDSGRLSQEDLVNLQNSGKLEQIGARTAGALQVGAQRIQGAKDIRQMIIDTPNYHPLRSQTGNLLIFDEKTGDVQDTGKPIGAEEYQKLIQDRQIAVKQAAPTTETTTTKEKVGGYLGGLIGGTPTTTTIRKPVVTPNLPSKTTSGDQELRARATKILTDAKKPVTEANIQHVIKQLQSQK